MTKRSRTSDPLQVIPGIGPSLADDLRDLGICEVNDLHGQDPQAMYERLTVLRGVHMDRCVLYTFRCAVYFANNQEHDPELLKWWNWQDKKVATRTTSRSKRKINDTKPVTSVAPQKNIKNSTEK